MISFADGEQRDRGKSSGVRHYWVLKNSFELKNPLRVTLDGKLLRPESLTPNVGWGVSLSGDTETPFPPCEKSSYLGATVPAVEHGKPLC